MKILLPVDGSDFTKRRSSQGIHVRALRAQRLRNANAPIAPAA